MVLGFAPKVIASYLAADVRVARLSDFSGYKFDVLLAVHPNIPCASEETL
jgi:hypothetical protein